jgi:hypothetical protein
MLFCGKLTFLKTDQMFNKIKYIISDLQFIGAFISPFKPPKLKFYIGKASLGTPYFFPRRWVKVTKDDAIQEVFKRITKYSPSDEDLAKRNITREQYLNDLYRQQLNYYKAVPKLIGFDFVPLGWKTKWDSFRFEWSPLVSFVFFKWQIAVMVIPIEQDHYWECWLEYYFTDKKLSTKERLELAMKKNPCIWESHKADGTVETTNYWKIILKDKWKKYIKE